MKRVLVALSGLLLMACSNGTPSASSSPVYFGTPDTSTPAPTAVTTPVNPHSPKPSLPDPHATPTDCHALANGSEPDPKCTPGLASPLVTQDNLFSPADPAKGSGLCSQGYRTSVVRPQPSVTEALIKVQFQYYHLEGAILPNGLAATRPMYEEDHLIPLELGGDPSSPYNLWPQPRTTTGITPSAENKDLVENYLHDQVCYHKMKIAEAQHAISSDWIAVYRICQTIPLKQKGCG